MKLKYIIASLLAGVTLFTACEKEADHFLSEVKVDKSFVGFPKEGGSQTIVVTANDVWSIEISEADAAWLSASPASGAAGSHNVTITAQAGEDGHKTSINLVCAGQKQIINVTQEAGEKKETPITPIADAIAAGAGSFRLQGTVTKVANTDYGNFYIEDETGSIYIYGVKDAKGYPKDDASGWARFGIEAGDKVVVEGPFKLYNDTPELVDAEVISVTKSLIDVAAFSFQMLPAIDTTFEMVVTSKLSPVLVTTDADWLKVVDLKEKDGSLVYSLTASANPELSNRTAEITVKASDALKAVSVTQVAREATEDDILVKHVDEVLAAEPANGPFYKITGRIKEIVNDTYGNFYLEDGTGEIYVYGLTATNVGIGGKNDKSFASLGLAQNDVITIIGVRGRYDSASDPRQKEQLGSAYYVSHKPTVTATVAEFLAAEVSTEKYYELTGTVTEIANETYGNIYVEDATGNAYLYGLVNAPLYNLETGKFSNNKSFSTLGVTVGAKVTVRGFRGVYNDSPQMTDAFLVKVEEGSVPPVAGGITIDGDASDWNGVANVNSLVCPDGAAMPALKAAKILYSDKLYIMAQISDEAIADGKVRLHVYFDTDETGKVQQHWNKADIDYMTEGKITDTGKGFVAYSSSFYKWDGTEENPWKWADSGASLGFEGAGANDTYELAIDYTNYPGGLPEQFNIGIDVVYSDWAVHGYLPQTANKLVIKKDAIAEQPAEPAGAPSTIAQIIAQIPDTATNSDTAVEFEAELASPAVVSYVNGNNAYMQDATGAILLYMKDHGLVAGDAIKGKLSIKAYWYNGIPEMVAIGSAYEKAAGEAPAPKEITVADLLANYDANLLRLVVLKGVTVSGGIADGDRNGEISQGDDKIAVYAQLNNKGLVLTEGESGDLVTIPGYYKTNKQVYFWDNAWFTAAPAFTGITIDGDMSDWAGVQGATGTAGVNAAFKVVADDTNIYFYVKRTTERMSELWGGAAYHYYTFDTDNNAETGVDLWGNGPYELLLVVYPYAGSADAPAFGIAKAGATAPDTYTVDNAVIKGVVTDSGVETEIAIPRADILGMAGTNVNVYHWSNKGGSEKLQVNLTL